MDLKLNDVQRFLFLEDKAFRERIKEEIDLELQKEKMMSFFKLYI